MKKMKKLLSMLLAVIMILAMAAPSFAEETNKGLGNFTITLNNKNEGHTYTAYQVFKGDLSVEDNKKTLSNIEWADTVVREGLIAEIKACDDAFENLADNASARDVAEVLAEQSDDSEVMQKFVKAVRPFLGNKGTDSVQSTPFDETYTISGLEAGYYLVEDAKGGDQEGDAYSRYILEVVADVNANVKAETPEIEKKILEGNEKVDANTAGVGKTVSYEITGTVPQHQSYDKYYYVINDKLSDGLTFSNDITVTLNGVTLTLDKDYYVYTGNKADGNTFQVAFANIKELTPGAKISVTYSAVVNENAVVGEVGNPNKVTLEYSNNPNNSSVGENNKKPGTPDPDGGNVTGKTPEDITITYLAQADIVKTFVNSAGQTITGELPGAEFTITGTSKQTLLTNKTYYAPAEEGEYYLLKDGTYTSTAPVEPEIEEGVITNEATSHLYVQDADGNYKRYEEKTTTEITEVESAVSMTGTTDSEGKLTFKGLGEGTYTIEETKVPEGFNKAPNVTIVIQANRPAEVIDGTEKAEWTVGEGSTGGVTLDLDADGANYSAVYKTTIENRAGSLLPSTGGIGTTIFYAAGIILMAGAVFFVVRRKRA